MKTRLAAIVVFGAAVLHSVPLFAHHSFAAEFDEKKKVTIKGTITKVELTNPHGWLYLNVKDEQGNVENWAVETGAPLALLRQGGDVKKSLATGTVIIVDGWLARNGSKTVNGKTIKFADGREILAGTSNNAGQ